MRDATTTYLRGMTDGDVIRRALKKAKKQGWRLECPRRGHYFLVEDETGKKIVLPGTPSDWRSVRNTLALFRRNGIDL